MRIERHEISIFAGSGAVGGAVAGAGASGGARELDELNELNELDEVDELDRMDKLGELDRTDELDEQNEQDEQDEVDWSVLRRAKPERCPMCGSTKLLLLAEALAVSPANVGTLKDGLEKHRYHLHCSAEGEWWVCGHSAGPG